MPPETADQKLLLERASGLLQQGHLAQAEPLYLQLLLVQPPIAEARHMLGVLRLQQGRGAVALELMDEAVNIDPGNASAWNNRGVLLRQLGRHEDGLASFDRVVTIAPRFADGWNNRGNVLLYLKRHADALACFDRALAINPAFPSALFNRASLLLLDKKPEAALAGYDETLKLVPGHAGAWKFRANVLEQLGRVPEALASCERALALKPDFLDALNLRGDLLFQSGRIDEGIETFTRSVALGGGEEDKTAPSPHKLRHDQERQDYLAAVRGSHAAPAGTRLQGPAVRAANGSEALAEQWRSARPQIAVIDNLLTDEALEGLRRFCREAPVWRTDYAGGYLGAFPEHGFACPLVGQVAQELRQVFPAIIGTHPKFFTWGFKYDSNMSGINIHADEAAVNVNFWLTPDDANLDPESGGLVVWDVAAPMDWDFAKYNADTSAIRDFLARNGARPVKIPYRANRAVIFDSNLFHETDTIRFKPGYFNRRINITMLYGQRGQGGAAQT